MEDKFADLIQKLGRSFSKQVVETEAEMDRLMEVIRSWYAEVLNACF